MSPVCQPAAARGLPQTSRVLPATGGWVGAYAERPKESIFRWGEGIERALWCFRLMRERVSCRVTIAREATRPVTLIVAHHPSQFIGIPHTKRASLLCWSDNYPHDTCATSKPQTPSLRDANLPALDSAGTCGDMKTAAVNSVKIHRVAEAADCNRLHRRYMTLVSHSGCLTVCTTTVTQENSRIQSVESGAQADRPLWRSAAFSRSNSSYKLYRRVTPVLGQLPA